MRLFFLICIWLVVLTILVLKQPNISDRKITTTIMLPPPIEELQIIGDLNDD